MNVIKNNSHSRKSVSAIPTAAKEQGGDPRQKLSGMTSTINRHAELVSASSCSYNNKILKPVICQTPYKDTTGRGLKAAVQGNGRKGFTLIELLVVVLIIGVLAAVALPQYQKAVLKSRVSALMPIAKGIADAQEVYFLEKGSYSRDEESLMLDMPAQVNIDFSDKADLKYVAATDSDFPNIAYLVYQMHSPKFPATTMCEAATEQTEEVCQALGGEKISDNGSIKGWAAYLLSGDAGADTFGCSAGSYYASSGNDESVCTKAPAGSYVKDGELKSCAAGTYSAEEGSATCTKCAQGTYASGTGNTSCTACPAGRYSGSGKGSCSKCPAGTYSAKEGSSACTKCAKGTYASGTGNASCAACPAGTYASGTGSKSCTSCPEGTTPNATKTACE